ncbi:MAG: hypothetical protein N2235_22160 [Fischerella sp.]|nr:hypothetical protein [Fischerella sp.]
MMRTGRLNADRLEQQMKGLSPADSELIDDFCAGIRAFTHFDMSLLRQKPKAAFSSSAARGDFFATQPS